MREELVNYIKEKSLPGPGNSLLAGVSGGIDSMVMMHLLRSAGYKIIIAHCNFSLRGSESDLDEKLVSDTCLSGEIPFHSKRFNTTEYSRLNRLSIQMAARELRFEWFEQLRTDLGLDYIALGHNLNDQVETFIINLARGTGLQGLTGIKPVNGKIFRPLLFATREEIIRYARENNISFREDSSNSETKYARNKVRHNILPEIEKVNPGSLKTIPETIGRLSEAYEILSSTVESVRNEIFSYSGETILVRKKELQNLRPLSTYIYEIFKNFGVTPGQVDEIKSLIDANPGRMVITSEHRIMSDRENILIVPASKSPMSGIEIPDEIRLLGFNGIISAEIIERCSFVPVNNPDRIWIDADKISYPLVIRKWKEGDSFHPFGIKGRKKISDFLIDRKLSLYDKENVLVMESVSEIVWVIGLRADNRFRVDEETKRIVSVKVNR